jgi:hypothetical protein
MESNFTVLFLWRTFCDFGAHPKFKMAARADKKKNKKTKNKYKSFR